MTLLSVTLVPIIHILVNGYTFLTFCSFTHRSWDLWDSVRLLCAAASIIPFVLIFHHLPKIDNGNHPRRIKET